MTTAIVTAAQTCPDMNQTPANALRATAVREMAATNQASCIRLSGSGTRIIHLLRFARYDQGGILVTERN